MYALVGQGEFVVKKLCVVIGLLLLAVLVRPGHAGAQTGTVQTSSEPTSIFGLTIGEPLPPGPLCDKRVSEPCFQPPKEKDKAKGNLGRWRHPAVGDQVVWVGQLQGPTGPTVERVWAWWEPSACPTAFQRLTNTFGLRVQSASRLVKVKNPAAPLGYQYLNQITTTWELADARATYVFPTDGPVCELIVESPRYRENEAREAVRDRIEKGRF